MPLKESRKGGGLYNTFFGVRKDMLHADLVRQTLDIVRWEKYTICAVKRFGDVYSTTGKKGRINIDPESSFLILPVMPADDWCSMQIFEAFPQENKIKLNVKHGFPTDDDHSFIVADRVKDIL